MSEERKLIPVAEAEPGMVLSDELLDERGMVLLARGVELTESMIVSLKRKQIEMLPIASGNTPPPPDPYAIEQRLRYLFRRHGDVGSNAAGLALQQLVAQYRTGSGETA